MKHLKYSFTLLLTALFVTITSLTASAADTPVLRWGGDAEGNVPYMFTDPVGGKKMVGFEVDIANAIAQKMHMTPRFVHNGWDSLIPGLDLGLYDIALSGLEITPEHECEVDFSMPYYKTFLQLTVRKGNPSHIETLRDCVGKTVGTLKLSYAQKLLEATGVSDIRTYENEINAYQDMALGRLDVVLIDSPIAIFYAGFNPDLEFVGEPIGEIYYGIPVKKGNTEFLEKLNAALIQMRDEGTLRRICDRWNMWTPVMADFFNDHSPATGAPVNYNTWADFQRKEVTVKQRLNRYISFLPIFGKAAVITLEVSILAMALAIVLGLILTVTRLFAPKLLSGTAAAFIEIVRGTPVLIQLFFIFYGLPNIGIKLSPFMAGVIGLGMNYAAYEAENYRAGLLAVPRAQMEGALALGMSKHQALYHVVIPQAFRIALPPVTNDFISLLKDSSLVSMITLVDLTKAYSQLANTYYDYFGTGIMVAVIYFLIGLPFVRLARYTERRLSVAVRGNRGGKDRKKVARPASYRN